MKIKNEKNYLKRFKNWRMKTFFKLKCMRLIFGRNEFNLVVRIAKNENSCYIDSYDLNLLGPKQREVLLDVVEIFVKDNFEAEQKMVTVVKEAEKILNEVSG